MPSEGVASNCGFGSGLTQRNARLDVRHYSSCPVHSAAAAVAEALGLVRHAAVAAVEEAVGVAKHDPLPRR